MAATPLGRDESGKNLVAYIFRTEEEAPPLNVPRGANGNNPQPRVGEQPPRRPPPPPPQGRPETAARFIKPDNLLGREQKAEVDHLRARDADIREQAEGLSGGDGENLITSFVYATGPDGKRYVLGVGLPLRAYTPSDEEKARRQPKKADGEPAQLPPEGAENVAIRAAIAYRHAAYNDAAGPRAGLLDSTL